METISYDVDDLYSDNDTFIDDVYEICDAGEKGEEIIKVFQTVMFCFVFLLGVAGNSLVIGTFALYRRLHLRSMTDVFIFHLALADLLLLLTLPLQGVESYLGWVFYDPLCKATRACYAMNTYSGLLLLACISVDRCIVVVWAQEVFRLRGQLLTAGKLASLVVWLAALLLSLPEIRFSGVSVEDGDSLCVIKEQAVVKRLSSIALIAVFCLSTVVMVTCYSSIGKVLWEGQEKRRGKGWQHQRTLKLMAALVLVFVVFQLPYTTVLLQKMARPFCGLILEYVTCTLAYSRCCLNPILYALVGTSFRNDVRKLLNAACCRCWPKLVVQSGTSSNQSPSPPAVTLPLSPSPPP